MMDTMNLLKQTNELLAACEEASERFYRMREENCAPDFYEEVKPYADKMRAVLIEWQRLAKAYIAYERPKYLHEAQIQNAVDAMEQFFVQSFYKETSKKRFLQSIQAVKYTLDTLKRTVEGGEARV